MCASKRVASSSLPSPDPLSVNAWSCVRKNESRAIETRVPLKIDPTSNDVRVSARKMRSNDGSRMSVAVADGLFTSYVFAYWAVIAEATAVVDEVVGREVREDLLVVRRDEGAVSRGPVAVAGST